LQISLVSEQMEEGLDRNVFTSAGAVVSRSELVFVDLAAQRVAVNAENLRGTRLVAIGAVKNALDKTLFELSYGFFEQNAPIHHLND
jgi:hypothetical protein